MSDTLKQDRLTDVVKSVERELQTCNEQIINDADWLVRRLNETVLAVKNDESCSSRGVLQSNAIDFDALIIKRQSLAEQLQRLRWAQQEVK